MNLRLFKQVIRRSNALRQKAQISMEYLIIVGFVAAVTVPMIIIFTTHSTEMNESIISNEAENIAAKIVDAAESVYYLGEFSKTTFRVSMPKNINSITLGNNEVVIFVDKMNGFDEVVKYCPVPINGSVSKEPGLYDIVVESRGDYVWVESN
ncbi:hypothetical protein GF336_04190 [Candidatus Woesearchaeota archaeon]|nr:hypothetical protein [Candidatus Woesearchaeota archaeon]